MIYRHLLLNPRLERVQPGYNDREQGLDFISNNKVRVRMAARVGNRVKVAIRCNLCGERFVLRGKKEQGDYLTGFKQCLCSNEHDFEIVVQDHV